MLAIQVSRLLGKHMDDNLVDLVVSYAMKNVWEYAPLETYFDVRKRVNDWSIPHSDPIAFQVAKMDDMYCVHVICEYEEFYYCVKEKGFPPIGRYLETKTINFQRQLDISQIPMI